VLSPPILITGSPFPIVRIRGRPHLGDTCTSLWFARSRPHRCKRRRRTLSSHQKPAAQRSLRPHFQDVSSLSPYVSRSCGGKRFVRYLVAVAGERAKWNSFHLRRAIEQVCSVHPQPVSPRDAFARALIAGFFQAHHPLK
jgi:hypothetical protein